MHLHHVKINKPDKTYTVKQFFDMIDGKVGAIIFDYDGLHATLARDKVEHIFDTYEKVIEAIKIFSYANKPELWHYRIRIWWEELVQLNPAQVRLLLGEDHDEQTKH